MMIVKVLSKSKVLVTVECSDTISIKALDNLSS